VNKRASYDEEERRDPERERAHKAIRNDYRKDRTFTIIGGVVALIAILTAAILGLTVVNPEADSTPIITTLVALIGPTVAALLAVLKTEKTDDKVDALTNGLMTEKVREALSLVLSEPIQTEDGTTSTTITTTKEGKPDG
jgi:hypothetical protein